ncbi:MAG: DUF2461 domain-containing protein [Chitinophagaceae bacterium]
MRSILPFLKKLKQNNNKPWFDENRSTYEIAKKEWESIVESLIAGLATKDPSISTLKPKDCMFRINRDVRFSNDKSPYKTNFGAFICKGGKKSQMAGYYVHLEPGNSFVGGGLWMPMAPQLSKLRQEIDYNFSAFKKIILSSSFKKIYSTLDMSKETSLSRVPKGYESENPAAEFLKLKSFVATRALSDKEVNQDDFKKTILSSFAALQPLIYFINEGISESE